MKPPKIVLVALALTSFAFASARVQEVTGVLDMTGMGIYSMEEAVMDAARETSRSKTPKKVKVPAASLKFTPSMARRKQFMKSFVTKMRTVDAKTATGIEKLNASKDLIAEMGKVIAPYGLRTDNVADAYAIWWIASWHASREKELAPNRSQFLAVKAQASRALGVAMKSSKVSDATKQQFAEACLMQALLIDAALENAKGDQGRLREIARSASQGARASGLNLAVMELTPKGFVMKG